ncbi:MAG TPA: ATP-binding cassette domain-containing protein [Firmicutes bacterium]|nr:ATP-binding cassette domain-containing protein [Candidatus Fermentithermobacillaceae bacterium]
MIEVRNLSVTFLSPSGEVEALCDVSLTISDGEIVAICGPSGAGKTTLLRCLSMLQPPSSGRILVDGEDVSSRSAGDLSQARRKIGMVFQGFNLLRSRTALQNVMLPLEIRKVPRKEAIQKAEEYLELVHMSHRRDFYPEDLSGGEKQRVSIARALVTEPRVLILDEPTSALDPETAASIVQSLKEINRARNITILVVTHQIDVLAPICDRITYLRNGRLTEGTEKPEVGFGKTASSAPSATTVAVGGDA